MLLQSRVSQFATDLLRIMIITNTAELTIESASWTNGFTSFSTYLNEEKEKLVIREVERIRVVVTCDTCILSLRIILRPFNRFALW